MLQLIWKILTATWSSPHFDPEQGQHFKQVFFVHLANTLFNKIAKFIFDTAPFFQTRNKKCSRFQVKSIIHSARNICTQHGHWHILIQKSQSWIKLSISARFPQPSWKEHHEPLQHDDFINTWRWLHVWKSLSRFQTTKLLVQNINLPPWTFAWKFWSCCFVFSRFYAILGSKTQVDHKSRFLPKTWPTEHFPWFSWFLEVFPWVIQFGMYPIWLALKANLNTHHSNHPKVTRKPATWFQKRNYPTHSWFSDVLVVWSQTNAQGCKRK